MGFANFKGHRANNPSVTCRPFEVQFTLASMFLYSAVCSERTGLRWSRWSRLVAPLRRPCGRACSASGSGEHRWGSSSSEPGPSGKALSGSPLQTPASHSCEGPGRADARGPLLEHCPVWLSAAPGPLPGQSLCRASLTPQDSAAKHSSSGTDAGTGDRPAALLGTTARAEFLPMDPFRYRRALSPVGSRRPASLRPPSVSEASTPLWEFPSPSATGVFSGERESARRALPFCAPLSRLRCRLSQSSPACPFALAVQAPRVPVLSLMLCVLCGCEPTVMPLSGGDGLQWISI